MYNAPKWLYLLCVHLCIMRWSLALRFSYSINIPKCLQLYLAFTLTRLQKFCNALYSENAAIMLLYTVYACVVQCVLYIDTHPFRLLLLLVLILSPRSLLQMTYFFFIYYSFLFCLRCTYRSILNEFATRYNTIHIKMFDFEINFQFMIINTVAVTSLFA